jgi:hypothetical protein
MGGKSFVSGAVSAAAGDASSLGMHFAPPQMDSSPAVNMNNIASSSSISGSYHNIDAETFFNAALNGERGDDGDVALVQKPFFSPRKDRVSSSSSSSNPLIDVSLDALATMYAADHRICSTSVSTIAHAGSAPRVPAHRGTHPIPCT